jgi:hypothetical protein
MDKNEFWQLIQDSYQEANWETDKQMEILINKLAIYSEEEILKFQNIYDIYAEKSYKTKLWAAAYVMNGGCSDDGFDYFRGWLISRGKEPYLNSLIDPDSIADLDMPYDDEYFENEEMLGVALRAYNKKIITDDINIFFKQISKFELDPEEIADIVDEISFGDDIDADWDEDNDETLRKLVPKLYEKFW